MPSESENENKDLLRDLERRHGGFPGYRITVLDPENPKEKSVYEDIENELGAGGARMCVVSLYPDYGHLLIDGGDTSTAQETITHAKALADIWKSLGFGYVISEIVTD